MSDFDGDDDHHMKWMSKKLEAIWQIVTPLGSSSRLKVWPDLLGLSGFCWENVKRELVHHQRERLHVLEHLISVLHQRSRVHTSKRSIKCINSRANGQNLGVNSFNTHHDLKYFFFSLVEVELDALGGSFGTWSFLQQDSRSHSHSLFDTVLFGVNKEVWMKM